MKYRWVILAMVWLVYAAMGSAMSSTAPLVTPILSDLKISYAEMGVILGSWQPVFIPFSLIAGVILDRWGIRKTLFFASLIVALSVGLRYFATGFTTLLIMTAIFGIGGPFISIGAQKAVSLWFTGRERPTAVGIYMTAPSVGGMFALAATNSLIMPMTGYSWRLTFVFYSLLALLFGFVWLVFSRDIKQTAELTQASLWSVFIKIIKAYNVRIVLIAGLITGLMIHGFVQWLPKMIEYSGVSAETAGYLSSIVSAVGIPATLFLPRMIPNRLRGRFLALFAFLSSAGILITAIGSSWVIVGLILYGAAIVVLFPLLTVVLMDAPQVSAETMGLAGGIFFAFCQIGGSLGPMLMGITTGSTGSFLAGIWTLVIAGLVLASITFILRESKSDS
ncbi:MAG TPA: MFS transporter [Dehalococcoidia bacterium]|nr:MFS transporter [Dehalococcoidia bacterium]